MVKKTLKYEPILFSLFSGVITSWLIKGKITSLLLSGKNFDTSSDLFQIWMLILLFVVTSVFFLFIMVLFGNCFPQKSNLIFRNIKPTKINSQKPSNMIDYPKGALILYTSILMVVWVIYLLALWPGGMSPDSINQWNQMITFKFDEWHPVFHTLTNWLITRFWLSPAAVALVQIFALSLTMAWGLVEQRRLGAPRWLPWVVITLIIMIPTIGLFVIVLWKDVFFSISVVALTILIFKITMSQGEWIQKRASWVYLSIVSLLVALYRYNGVLVAFGTLFCLLIVYRQSWKRILLVLIITLLLFVGIRGPFYYLLGVGTSGYNPGVEMAVLQVIARYTNSNTYFSPEEQSLYLKMIPEKKWSYDCYSADYNSSGNLNWGNLFENKLELVKLTAKLIYRNPGVFVDHILCNSSFLYQITQPPGSYYERLMGFIIPNELGLSSESKLPGVKNAIDSWVGESIKSYNWLFWRVPIWNYLFLAGILVFWARSKNWKITLIAVPILLNMLPLAILNLVQNFRYVFSSLLVSVLMSGYLISTDYHENR